MTREQALNYRWQYSGPIPVMRGAATAAENQLALTNQAAGAQGAQATALEKQLLPLYTSELTQGYTPEQKAGITTAGMEAAAAPFAGARQEAENRAARTRNEAGVSELEDRLAREAGQAQGREAAGLQQGFANREQLNRQLGLQGLGGLYGQNLEAMERLYGLGPETINAWSQAQMRNPVLSLVGQGIGAAGMALAGV